PEVRPVDFHGDDRISHAEGPQTGDPGDKADAAVGGEEVGVSAGGAEEVGLREHHPLAGDDLAVAKRAPPGGTQVPRDDPASVDVEATVEGVGATLVPDDVVDHARQEQGVE